MKISEIILNKLAKTLGDSRLFELARSRRDVESRITSLSDPIIEHLIKLLKWDDSLNYTKHCRDIRKWMIAIQRLRYSGGRKPTSTDYFKWMFIDVVYDESTLEQWIRSLHEYETLSVIRTDEEVFNIIKAMIYQISFDLELNQFTDISKYLPK
jgi:hypothetical protein